MSSQTVEDPAPATEADLEHTIEEIRCYQVSFKHNGAEIGRAQLHASASHILEVVDLFVKPEYRGRGYSHRILSQLTGLAHELGASQVSAHTSADNLPAYRAFQQIGFVPHHNEVHLETPISAKQTPHTNGHES
jgi:N-acetylglutamate synthase-like GNAT family acetyltransferase